MPVFAAVLALKQSGAFKALLSQGDKILADLTGCKVKPKGTPHVSVWEKMPKVFFVYGGPGVPGEGKFKLASYNGQISGLFDIVSGVWIRDIDAALSKDERRKLEQTARHKCETLTADWGYYAEPRPPTDFQGFVRLSDGELYDAKMYGVKGGSTSTPVEMRSVKPRGNIEGAPSAGDQPRISSGGNAGDLIAAAAKIGGIYLAYKTFAG